MLNLLKQKIVRKLLIITPGTYKLETSNSAAIQN
jgi:hypothetical protein